MTIAERVKLRKPVTTPSFDEAPPNATKPRKLPQAILLMALVALASLGSFGLGVLAGREEGAGKRDDTLWIEKLQAASQSSASTTEHNTNAKPDTEAAAPKGGEVVASKTGTKYYLPWCGTAKRIKEENKVWFASRAAAEAAGYEPAKNCKGL